VTRSGPRAGAAQSKVPSVIFVKGSLLRPKQLRLTELFSAERVLASRGFQIDKQGDGTDTIIPRNVWEAVEADAVFSAFNDVKARVELLHFSRGDGQMPTSPLAITVAQFLDFKKDHQAFTRTFEWYVGELLIRSFQAFSSSYGVEIKEILRSSGTSPAGDFDVLTVLGDTSLLYLECKTGGFDRAKTLAMIERAEVLHCAASVMFVGAPCTKVTIREMLKHAKYPRLPVTDAPRSISIKGVPGSDVFAWHDAYFVPADAGGGEIEPKLRTILRMISARRIELDRVLTIEDSKFEQLGFEINAL
jgi:hypothetical protein